MNSDTVMWLGLLVAGVCLCGYLFAALIHPEKW